MICSSYCLNISIATDSITERRALKAPVTVFRMISAKVFASPVAAYRDSAKLRTSGTTSFKTKAALAARWENILKISSALKPRLCISSKTSSKVAPESIPNSSAAFAVC